MRTRDHPKFDGFWAGATQYPSKGTVVLLPAVAPTILRSNLVDGGWCTSTLRRLLPFEGYPGMALVLMCGFPASGKTVVSEKLRELLEGEGQEVHVVRDGEDSIGNDGEVAENGAYSARRISVRAEMYRDSTMEKETRARLRAATERSLNGSRVVICDSLNYIKGFRYEMYCVAKTTSTTYCVVFCEQSAETCAKRDAERGEKGDDTYGAELCEGLIRRFETPSERNRWDSPLHRVDTSQPCWELKLGEIRDSALKRGAQLTPTMATRVPETLGADVLGTLDRLTREAEAVIVADIQGGTGVGQKITVPGASKEVNLERKPRVAELRNMRRSYLNLARMHPPQGQSRQALVDEYVEYVNAQLMVKR